MFLMLECVLDDKNQLLHLYIDYFDMNDLFKRNSGLKIFKINTNNHSSLIEVGLVVDVYHMYEYHNLIDQQHDVFLGNLLMDE
jgi:hypothetical protein